jgi:hypothetical protein
VAGLSYLDQERLEHGSLSCSNILVSNEGVVKIGLSSNLHHLVQFPNENIAGYENCSFSRLGKRESPDIRALERITAELMGGYVKEDGVISLTDPGSWDPIALNFLADTTSAESILQLIEASPECTVHSKC